MIGEKTDEEPGTMEALEKSVLVILTAGSRVKRHGFARSTRRRSWRCAAYFTWKASSRYFQGVWGVFLGAIYSIDY